MSPSFDEGERVRMLKGSFEGEEGEVESVDPSTGTVTVTLILFGRRTPVDVDARNLERV